METTFEKLAELVADVFRRRVNEDGFNTFREMKLYFDMDANDIKREFRFIVNGISKNAKETLFMKDSCVMIGSDKMSWKDFKKLVFGYLK